MKLNRDLREFIEWLNSHRVEYLVVGGHAVAFHGYPRYTGDIDFLLRRNDENAAKVVEALKSFGFPNPEQFREVLNEPDKIVQLGRPPNRIDLLTSASGLEFEDVWAASVEGELDGLPVRFPDLSSLLRNKRAAGRPKDLADADELDKRSRPPRR